MERSELEQKVLEYVKEADVPLLKLMEALAEGYQKEQKSDTALTEEAYEILDRRREAHLKGDSRSLEWEEVRQNARDAAK